MIDICHICLKKTKNVYYEPFLIMMVYLSINMHNYHLLLYFILLIWEYFEKWSLCLWKINLWSKEMWNNRNKIWWVFFNGDELIRKNDTMNSKIFHLPLCFCYNHRSFPQIRLITSNNLKSEVKFNDKTKKYYEFSFIMIMDWLNTLLE